MSFANGFAAQDTRCDCVPNTKAGAFAPVPIAPENVAGLVQIYEPGTRFSPMAVPQNLPGPVGLMPGQRTPFISSRFGWAQNFSQLLPFARGGYPSPVAAVRPMRFGPRRPNPPAAIPGVSTWWPRALPSWPTYGGPPVG